MYIGNDRLKKAAQKAIVRKRTEITKQKLREESTANMLFFLPLVSCKKQ